MNRILATVTTVFTAFVFSGIATAQLQVDLSKSSITAGAKQMNIPMEGTFKKFTATVHFDAAKLAEAKASIDIDMASFDLGSEDFNQEIRKKDFFDSAKFPKATFVTISFKAAGTDKFTVVGKLTIKGKTQEVSTTLNHSTAAGVQTFEGTLPVKRLAFDVGVGEWKDPAVVSEDVRIKFKITTKK